MMTVRNFVSTFPLAQEFVHSLADTAPHSDQVVKREPHKKKLPMYLNTCVIFWATKSIAEKKKKGIHVNMRQWEEPHPFLCPALAALTLSIYHLKVEVSVSISIGKVSYNSKRTCSTGKWLAEKACLQISNCPCCKVPKKSDSEN